MSPVQLILSPSSWNFETQWTRDLTHKNQQLTIEKEALQTNSSTSFQELGLSKEKTQLQYFFHTLSSVKPANYISKYSWIKVNIFMNWITFYFLWKHKQPMSKKKKQIKRRIRKSFPSKKKRWENLNFPKNEKESNVYLDF